MTNDFPISRFSSKRLRKMRERKGLKMADVVHRMQCTLPTYGGWERGTTKPSAGDITILCCVLGCSPEDLHE